MIVVMKMVLNSEPLLQGMVEFSEVIVLSYKFCSGVV